MHGYRLEFVVLAATLLCGAPVLAPQGFPGPRQSVRGQLTVTATVVSSVGMVVGPDGEQRLIAANAADPRDNVSQLQSASMAEIRAASALPQRGPAKRPAKIKSGN